MSTTKVAAMKPIISLIDSIKKETSLIDFPGKDKFLITIRTLEIQFKTVLDEARSIKENAMQPFQKKIDHNAPLSKKTLERLRFQEGFAIEEIKDTQGNIFQQYRKIDGTVALEGRFLEASAFRDGVATVKTADGLGMINTRGQWIIEPKYDVLHSMSDTVKIGKIGDRYTILRLSENKVTSKGVPALKP